MFRQLWYAFAPQQWLRTWNPREKHYLLGIRIAEVIDGAMSTDMDIEEVTLTVTRGGIGLTLVPELTNISKLLAEVRFDDVPSVIAAYRLLRDPSVSQREALLDDAVEQACDDLADAVLRQIYGDAYLEQIHRDRR